MTMKGMLLKIAVQLEPGLIEKLAERSCTPENDGRNRVRMERGRGSAGVDSLRSRFFRAFAPFVRGNERKR